MAGMMFGLRRRHREPAAFPINITPPQTQALAWGPHATVTGQTDEKPPFRVGAVRKDLIRHFPGDKELPAGIAPHRRWQVVLLEWVFADQLPLLRGRKELPRQAGPSSDGRLGKLLLNQEGPECNGILVSHIPQGLLVPKEIEQIANRMAPMHHCLWLDVRATGAVVVQKLAQANSNAGLHKTGGRQLAVQFIAYAVHPLDNVTVERAAHANAVQQVLKFDPDGVAQPL